MAFDHKKIYKINRVLALPLNHARASSILIDHLKRRSYVDPPSLARHLSKDVQSGNEDISDAEDLIASPPDADEDPPAPSVENEAIVQDAPLSPPSSKINLGRLLWRPKPNRTDLLGSTSISKKTTSIESNSLASIAATTSTPTPDDPPRQRAQTLLGNLLPTIGRPRAQSTTDSLQAAGPQDSAARLALDRKVIKELCTELSHGGMYYSLDLDITHCLQKQSDRNIQAISKENLSSASEMSSDRV